MAKPVQQCYVAYVGTTKVAFLKAKVLNGYEPEVAAYGACLASGFERGIVKDIYQASQTISGLVKDILSDEERSLIPCRLVISNAYLKNHTYQSSVYFQDQPHALTMKDVRHAIAQTRSIATIPLNEVIIQAVPQSFLVNDIDGIQNPIGLEASRLGVTLRLITMDFHVYSNLLKVFERCDLEVTDVIPGVLSSAHAILTDEEKQEGVVFVNIGGAVSHFACYQNSVLINTSLIPIGGDVITEEIERQFNLSHLDAQRLKEAFGAAARKAEFRDELIPIQDSKGNKIFHIKRSEFETHLNTGLQRFFSEISRHLKDLQQQYAPLSHVVMTGGGIKLDGVVDIFCEIVSPAIRNGSVRKVKGPETLVSNPENSGILGAITYTSRISDDERLVATPQNWFAKATDTVRNWLFENF